MRVHGKLMALWVTALFIGVGQADAQLLRMESAETTVLPSTDDPPCDGTFMINGDEDWENAWAWDPAGNVPPDFGGFADGYVGTGTVCGIRAYLTTIPGYFNGDETADAYVYESDGVNPTTVLSVTVDIDIEEPGHWPEISTHEIEVPPTQVDGDFFVYLWGNYPDGRGWFVAADYNGPPGLPRTKVAPGLGYPEGWQDVEILWGETAAMGVGVYLDTDPSPVESPTWGRIRSLFR